MSRTIQFAATDPDPGSGYTLAYRQFFARLRRARIDKGLSLLEVAELVGLQLPLAYEVETLIVPLPFEWLKVWCKVVGVPFADYLVVYWESQEAYFQKREKEREVQTAREREGILNAPASAPETAPVPEAPALSRFTSPSPLRAAFVNLARFLRARFSTSKKGLI